MTLLSTAESLVSHTRLGPIHPLRSLRCKHRVPADTPPSDMRNLMCPTAAKMKSLQKRREMRALLKVPMVSMVPVSSRTQVDRHLTAPPAAKKRKTAPASNKKAPEVVSDEEEEEEEEEGEPEEASDEAVPVGDDEEGDGEEESAEETEGVEATAKSGGPAASAKAAKKSEVPKEDDLEEVKGDSE